MRADDREKVLIEGMKLIRRLATVSPLAEFLLDSDVPKNFEDLSDDQLSEHIDKRQFTCFPIASELISKDSETIYHPVSSCKIGRSGFTLVLAT